MLHCGPLANPRYHPHNNGACANSTMPQESDHSRRQKRQSRRVCWTCINDPCCAAPAPGQSSLIAAMRCQIAPIYPIPLMTMTITKRLTKQVSERAQHRCEYCQTSEWLSGQRHEIDHIIPRARGGETDLDNLCLACAMCNGHKADRILAVDPESGVRVQLFNPRTQPWRDHFHWDAEGIRIVGLTPCGRATVAALKMNQPLILSARATWVSVKRHPPHM